MIIMTVLETAVYIFICIFGFKNPDTINFFKTETDVLIDIIIGFVVVSVSLGITMTLHLRLYNQRQKELEAARKQVEEYSKMKSELFAGMSHEMRTPLAVMSAYAQFAVEQIRESGANEQTLADLATISDEAIRLAEMADGTLKILTAASRPDDINFQKIKSVDMRDLSSRLINLLKPIAAKKGKKLTGEIKGDIPEIHGDADALTQLVWNLLQNAIIHSECKTITLIAEAAEKGVRIIVKDDGVGIKPDILPNVLDRGISGKEGTSGLGLSICLDIAKRHGGNITVLSEPEAGTSITVLLHNMTV